MTVCGRACGRTSELATLSISVEELNWKSLWGHSAVFSKRLAGTLSTCKRAKVRMAKPFSAWRAQTNGWQPR